MGMIFNAFQIGARFGSESSLLQFTWSGLLGEPSRAVMRDAETYK
jgi:hypothetical protein